MILGPGLILGEEPSLHRYIHHLYISALVLCPVLTLCPVSTICPEFACWLILCPEMILCPEFTCWSTLRPELVLGLALILCRELILGEEPVKKESDTDTF